METNFYKKISVAFIFCAIMFCRPPFILAMPKTLQDLVAIQDALLATGLIHGDIPSLNSPQLNEMREATMNMEPNDRVFVVPFPDGVRIYPQKIMVWHEVANELIKGVPYCITYCPLSGSLAVYSSKVGQHNLIFDVEGQIFNSNTVLIDRNTGSLWSQLLGIAFEGPLMGAGMDILPCYWMTWHNAREAFPDARVLATPRGGWRNYNRDPYGSYLIPGNYYDDERILFPMTNVDSRLPAKNQVIGLEVDDYLMAIDIKYIQEKKVINFFSGITPLVAIHDTKLDVVRIFERDIWEGHNPALFSLVNNEIRDVQTKSLWNMEGQCLDGNLAGVGMKQLFGIYTFWFVWSAFHPETELVPGSTVVPDSALIIGEQ